MIKFNRTTGPAKFAFQAFPSAVSGTTTRTPTWFIIRAERGLPPRLGRVDRGHELLLRQLGHDDDRRQHPGQRERDESPARGNGTAVTQSAMTYIFAAVGDLEHPVVATSTVYRNTDGRAARRRVTLILGNPAPSPRPRDDHVADVSTGENGPNSATAMVGRV